MMNDQRIEYIARDRILNRLPDAEVARVSPAETAPRPSNRDEYINLEDLGRGVQRALRATAPMGRVLPRKALQDDTWTRIVAQLGAIPLGRPPELQGRYSWP